MCMCSFLAYVAVFFSVFFPSVFSFVSSRETPALPFGVALSLLTNQINNNISDEVVKFQRSHSNFRRLIDILPIFADIY